MRDPIPGYREQLVDHGPGVLKIGGRLEQRHHTLWMRISGERLEEHDGEHVGRAARHRDHVRAERFGRQRRCRAEGVEHVANRRRDGRIVWYQGGRCPRSARNLADEHRDAFVFRRCLKRGEIPHPREPRDRLSMTARLLSHIERRQHEPEGRDAPQNIPEAPGSNQPVAGRRERAMAGEQGRRELVGLEKRRRGAVIAVCVLELGGGVARVLRGGAPRPRAGASDTVRRRSLPAHAIRRRRRRSTVPRAARRSPAHTGRRPPSAPSRPPGG